MNKKLLFVTAALALALAAGCGKKESTTVYSGKEGSVTVTKSGDDKDAQVEIKTKEGTYKSETKPSITEKELGVPIYPGAQSHGGGTYEGQNEQGASKVQSYAFETSDGFDKVYEFYKSRLKNVKNQMKTSNEGNENAFFMIGDDKKGITVSIATNKDEKKTVIAVVKGEHN